jgi:hypothetical protein
VTPDEKYQGHPPSPKPRPSVYGGAWGEAGKQNPKEKGETDRPGRIETPDEAQGQGEDGAAVDTQSET